MRASPSKPRPTSRRGDKGTRSDESFPKEDRLLKRSDFLRVQSHGRKIGTKSLLILVARGMPGRKRLGITVSRKVGNSVLRNRLKRLIRELFRRNRVLFPQSADVVVIPKRVGHRLEYKRLVSELEELSRRERC